MTAPTTTTARYVLDPTGERTVAERQRLDRPASVAGLKIGLLDISKPRGDVFLDRLQARLTEAGASVQRYRKPTFTKPALAATSPSTSSIISLIEARL